VGLAELDVSRFPWAAAPQREPALAGYLAEHLRLLAGDVPCAVSEGPRPLAAPPGRVAYEWALACPASEDLSVRSDLLVAQAPNHLHFARVIRDGAPLPERVLSAREPSWHLAGPAEGTSFAGYLRLGVEHILGGYDHLAFLLALLLTARSAGELARMVTGFTVAHSITLALAVLGWLRPERAPVEAVIGLSIVLVASENVWMTSGASGVLPAALAGALAVLAGAAGAGYGRVPALTLAGLALFAPCWLVLLRTASRPAGLRWTVVFLFGLVHGFGFAAALTEAHVAPTRLAPALLGFNAGVEVGQLAVVALAWPLLGAGAGRRPALVEVGSAAVAGLGAFWFVSRAFG
jgi:hypothetical protein